MNSSEPLNTRVALAGALYALILFWMFDSPREPVLLPKWLFYAKDLLVGVLLIIFMGAYNWISPLTKVGYAAPFLLLAFVLYTALGVGVNELNYGNITRYVKKFYWVGGLVSFFFVPRLLKRDIGWAMRVIGGFSVPLVIVSIVGYFLVEYILFLDEEEVHLGRFVLGQPSITVFPLLIVGAYYIFVDRSVLRGPFVWFLILVAVVASISGAALGSLIVGILLAVFGQKPRENGPVLIGVSMVMVVAAVVVWQMDTAEAVRAQDLFVNKIQGLYDPMDAPSMEVRQEHYKIAAKELEGTWGIGSGVYAWGSVVPWIENTYRVLFLEMGFIGVVLYVAFLLEGVLFGFYSWMKNRALRGYALFIIWGYATIAGYSLTLDIFHPFTLSIGVGLILAIHANVRELAVQRQTVGADCHAR